MDEALWLPTEKSVRVALRTQQIIAHESGVADSVDPLAGSYLIEHLTDEIEKGALDYIAKIDEMGGALQSIEKRIYAERDPERRLCRAAGHRTRRAGGGGSQSIHRWMKV